MIEICIDVGAHIISDRKLRTPTGYADTFRVLHEADLIDDALCDKLEKMAKFRNIVVHNYDRVDEAIVVSILHDHLEDFTAFKKRILELLR